MRLQLEESARREEALRAELDTLRQTLLDARAAAPVGGGDDAKYSPGDLNVPAQSSRASPLQPSAPRVTAPAVVVDDPWPPNGEAHHNDIANVEEDGYDYGVWHPAPSEVGSELSEESMELATPLHPTILSLADDLLIPSVPSTIHANTSMAVEPSEVPLPVSPDSTDANAPLLVFSSPPPPPPMPPPAHLPPPSSEPQMVVEPLRVPVPSDLLARVESMSQARVEAIEREFEEKRRELEQRTRELEEKNVALDERRRTADRLQGQISRGGSGDAAQLGAGVDTNPDGRKRP